MHWARRWWHYRRVHRAVRLQVLGDRRRRGAARSGARSVLGTPRVPRRPGLRPDRNRADRHAQSSAPRRAGARSASRSPASRCRSPTTARSSSAARTSRRGYFNAPEETRAAFQDGWFHTGDIGELDAQGQLHIRGRKKEMIVTPEGLNVFPEDVERVLNAQPGVRDSAVVGASAPGSTAERVQAVLVVEPGADVDDVVRAANARSAITRRSAPRRSGRAASCRAPKARASSSGASCSGWLAGASTSARQRRRAAGGAIRRGGPRALRARTHDRRRRRRSTSSG